MYVQSTVVQPVKIIIKYHNITDVSIVESVEDGHFAATIFIKPRELSYGMEIPSHCWYYR